MHNIVSQTTTTVGVKRRQTSLPPHLRVSIISHLNKLSPFSSFLFGHMYIIIKFRYTIVGLYDRPL